MATKINKDGLVLETAKTVKTGFDSATAETAETTIVSAVSAVTPFPAAKLRAGTDQKATAKPAHKQHHEQTLQREIERNTQPAQL
jgi:hypothetical protein